MNRDNISALLTAVAVIALIVGFAIYFNSPELNTAGEESIKQQQLIDKILSPESTANGGSSEGEKVRKMLIELASTRENNPVVIKLNRTEFDEIDKSKFREAPLYCQGDTYQIIQSFKRVPFIARMKLIQDIDIVDSDTRSFYQIIRIVYEESINVNSL